MIDFAKLFRRGQNTPAHDSEEEALDAFPGALSLDQIITRSKAAESENQRLAARVAELEAAAASAPDVAALGVKLKASTDDVAKLTAERDAANTDNARLKAENVELGARLTKASKELAGLKAEHETLTMNVERRVVQRLCELGIRGTPTTDPDPEPPRAEVTGMMRMQAAYEAQLKAR